MNTKDKKIQTQTKHANKGYNKDKDYNKNSIKESVDKAINREPLTNNR